MSSSIFVYQWQHLDHATIGSAIFGFGVNLAGDSTCLIVNNFKPMLKIFVPTDNTHHFRNHVMSRLLQFRYWLRDTRRQECGFVERFETTQEWRELESADTAGTTFILYIRRYDALKAMARYLRDKEARSNTNLSYDYPIGIYGADVDPVLQYQVQYNIPSTGWVEADAKPVSKIDCVRGCRHVVTASVAGVGVSPNQNIQAPIKVASFDIECESADNRSFPDADASDEIFQLSIVTNAGDRILITQGDDDIPCVVASSVVHHVRSEYDLLLTFIRLINDMDIHVMIGYNIVLFDLPYIYKRAKKLGMGRDLSRISRLAMSYQPSEISFNGKARPIVDVLQWIGRVVIDMYTFILPRMRLSDYKLATVAREYIGDIEKDPLTPIDIFVYWSFYKYQRQTDPERAGSQLSTIGTYCVKDSEIVLRMYEKTNAWTEMSEIARLCYLGVQSALYRGQQIRIFNQVYRYGHDDRVLVKKASYASDADDTADRVDDEGYMGAYVKEPVPGLYENVVPMDFCVTGDTLITMSDGSSRRIDTLTSSESVLSCVDGKLKSFRTINGLQIKGDREVITLHLQDGRTLTCTPDHKIMDEFGNWVEASETKGTHVRVGIEYPHDNSCVLETNYSLCGINMNSDRMKVLAMARIIGYIMADGSIYTSHGNPRCEASFGTLLDAENFMTDIELITGKRNQIRDRPHRGVKGSTFTVAVQTSLSKMIHSIDGIVVGKRSTQNMSLPSFVLEPECPLSVIREFLAGLFGGDGVAPYISGNSVGTIRFKWTTIEQCMNSMSNTMNQVIQLLSRFGITAILRNPIKIKYGKNSIKPKDYEINPRYDFELYIKLEDLEQFVNKIGFKYCINKMCRAVVASSYMKMCRIIRDQHNIVYEKVNELYISKFGTTRECLDVVVPELLSSNVIISMDSIPSTSYINYMRGEERRHWDKPRRKSLSKYCNFIGFIRELGVEDWFKPGAHALDGRAVMDIPTFRMKVIDIRPAGIQPVFDIEVAESHNFIANGIVAHNCSLYPSTIITYNIDWTTLVKSPTTPDDQCHIIEWVECCNKFDGCDCPPDAKRHHVFRFKKHPQGILPRLLSHLLNSRKQVKRDMKSATDPIEHMILDKRQNSLKICANSVYGSLGSSTSYLPFKTGAMCTTAGGRNMFLKAQQILRDHYEANIVYGDSCVGDTPILLKEGTTQRTRLQTIDAWPTDRWQPFRVFKSDDPQLTDKYQIDVTADDLHIWTHNGWARVRRIIRHHTHKKIYRVLTHTGCVDVTEDHSLLDMNANQIKPTDCKVGMELLHSRPPTATYLTHATPSKTFKSKLDAQSYYLSCDGHAIISISDGNTYTITPDAVTAAINTIQSITLLYETYNDYVYDIETDAGVFHAGIGSMIIKNTDSTYVQFHADYATSLQRLWDHATHIERTIQQYFPPTMKLAFEEKIYVRFLITAKKNYITQIADGPDTKPADYKMDGRGNILVRRDNCQVIRHAYQLLIDGLFAGHDQHTINTTLNDFILQHYRHQVPIDDYIMTKSFKDIVTYKIKELPREIRPRNKLLNSLLCETVDQYRWHALPAIPFLVYKRRQRGESVPDKSRVPFVIIESSTGHLPFMTEDPEFVSQHDFLRVDRHWYMKRMINPVDTLYKVVYNDDFVDTLYDIHNSYRRVVSDLKKFFCRFIVK